MPRHPRKFPAIELRCHFASIALLTLRCIFKDALADEPVESMSEGQGNAFLGLDTRISLEPRLNAYYGWIGSGDHFVCVTTGRCMGDDGITKTLVSRLDDVTIV